MTAPRVLLHAPPELTAGRLVRLGEGIGKVVYASEHWVVKRPRTPSEVVALILLWKLLPRRLLQHPSRPLRFLRLCVQAVMLVVPRSLWLSEHVKDVWRIYRSRDRRGERLAQSHLEGTSLVPVVIAFPPIRVDIGGWPGWLTVSEATARVEATLHEHLAQLARERRFDDVQHWLHRFLDLRQSGWQRGLFSLDAHLKNFGVAAGRIVLLDSGGLTDRWHEVHERLVFEEVVTQPHVQLGLGPILAPCPAIAEEFDARWKKIVNLESVRRHWPHAV
ncbi:MAG: hypothetical protein ACKV2U_24910 [Bryobacteraceae bacterium]